jgi:hypothetical protein
MRILRLGIIAVLATAGAYPNDIQLSWAIATVTP